MIETKNLSYTYPDGTRALSNIDLHIRSGETVLIAGPNGSGKSTLARHFNALLLPTEGEVLVEGVPTHRDELRARLLVGMVFQNPDDQIVGTTVGSDIAFGPENLGLSTHEIEERVEEAIHLMGLEELRDRSPHLLSEGQKRKVAIAGVLAMRPECLVLDDPLSGLDLPSISSLTHELTKLKERGYTIVFLSHRMEGLWRLANRLMIMNGGRIVEEGAPSELLLEGIGRYGIGEPASWKALRALRGRIDIEDLMGDNDEP